MAQTEPESVPASTPAPAPGPVLALEIAPENANSLRTVKFDIDAPPSSPCSILSPGTTSPQLLKALQLPFVQDNKKAVTLAEKQRIESLQFNAAEVSIECCNLPRTGLFSKAEYFVAIFTEGASKGTWLCQDKSECQSCVGSGSFVKKFRLRAATNVDRDEDIVLAFFDASMLAKPLTIGRAIAKQIFTVSELLIANQMTVEKSLCDSRGARMKAYSILAMDMVYHVKDKHLISFDFGCLGNVPLPNRVFFVISRALRKGRWTPVYKSEVRLQADADWFEPVSLDAQLFHAGDPKKLFRLEVFRWYKCGSKRLLGFMQINTEKLCQTQANDEIHWWPCREGIIGAKMLVQETNISEKEKWFCIRLAGLK